MSLDGFIAGANDEIDRVFAWMFSGDSDVKLSTGDKDIDLIVSPESAEQFQETKQSGRLCRDGECCEH